MTTDRPRLARLSKSLRRQTAGRETDPIAAAVAGYEAEAAAGRRSAARAGRPWAEPVELGVAIDPGAPVPHLVTDGLRAVLVFHAGLEPDPDWDGTSVTVVDPADATIRILGWIVFEGIREVSMGGPNDEGLHEHPLYGSGLVHYKAHEVRPVEPSSHEVIITFHDGAFTCVCSEWSSGSLAADFRTAMALAVNALRDGAAAFEGRDTRSAGTELHPDRLPFVQLFWNRQILDEAVENACNAGWEIVHLNAEAWTGPEDMHTALAQALSFPDYYGRNLDALNDSMYDVVQGDYGFGRHAPAGLIVIERFDSFLSREPQASQAVVDVLAGAGIDAVRRGWQLATFLQSDDPALQLAPVAAQPVVWNPKEWLNAKRGL